MHENKNGYYLLSDTGIDGKCMVLTAPWSPSFREVISSEHVTELRMSYLPGWTDTNIEFVRDLKMLRAVGIYGWAVTDISPLQELSALERIGLECNYKRSLDFSKFPNLKHCALKWRSGSDSVFQACGLTLLNISNYPFTDLTSLRMLHELEQLSLISAKLTTLRGIAALPALKWLSLYNSWSLVGLEGLGTCHELTYVSAENCKKLISITEMSSLSNLQELRINNCGTIKSLAPLKGCRRLEQLFFGGNTVVEDGDLSFYHLLPNLNGSSPYRVGDFDMILDWIEHASENLQTQIFLVM